MRCVRLGCLLLATFTLLHAALAYPWLWVAPDPDFDDRPAPACLEHPDPDVDEGATGRHPRIVKDSSLSIVVDDGASRLVTAVCPGGTYTVAVTLDGKAFHALISVSQGTFRSALPGAAINTNAWWQPCSNRLVSSLGTRHSDQLNVPCEAVGRVTLFVTAAQSPTGDLLQATLTLPLDSSCASAACGGSGGVGQPPPPAGRPPAPAPAPAVPRPRPPTILPPSPLPPPSRSTPDPVGSQLPPPPPSLPSSCLASDLGYACAVLIGAARLHYTVGGAAPRNACTGRGQTSSPGGSVVHMAVQAGTLGYVGLGFSGPSYRMAPADIVLGWVAPDGSSHVDAYSASGHAISAGDAAPWASGLGVVRSSDGQVVVCFSRSAVNPLARASQKLDFTQDVHLIWALSNSPALVQHTAQGGAAINLATSSIIITDAGAQHQLVVTRWHAALMAAAWALVLPLGTLLPRHPWLAGLTLWVRIHMVTQVVGLALVIPAFAIAWRYLNPPASRIGEAHRAMGTAAVGLLCFQVMAAVLRPSRTSKAHAAFAITHRWSGRVLLLLAWATAYLGIVVFHRSIHHAPYQHWLPPLSAALGLVLLLDIALSLIGARRQAAAVRAIVPAASLSPKASSSSSARPDATNLSITSSKPTTPSTPPMGVVTLRLDDVVTPGSEHITLHDNPTVDVHGQDMRFTVGSRPAVSSSGGTDEAAAGLDAGGVDGVIRLNVLPGAILGTANGVTIRHNPVTDLFARGSQHQEHEGGR